MPVWHLSSYSNPPRYVRLSGPASAPVVEADVVVNAAAGANDTTRGIYSPDGGQTIYIVGGDAVTDAQSNTFLLSTDGGATWTNKSADVWRPGANIPSGLGISGFSGDQSILACVETAFAGSGFFKYNTVAETLDRTGVPNHAYCNSIWAVPGTNYVYAVDFADPGNRSLWYSDDRGATWQQDLSYVTLGAGDGALHVVTDPRDGLIWTAAGRGGMIQFRYGYLGGGWTLEAPFAGAPQLREGRVLCCDETGAVWFFNNTDSKLYRRDPTSGVWASPLTTAGGARGGLWVVDSENILLSGGNGHLYIWDGSSWYTYLAVADLGLTAGSYWAVWGVGDAAPGCPDSIISPPYEIIEADFTIKNASRLPYEFQGENDCGVRVVPFSYNTPGRIFRNRVTAPSSSGNSCVMPHTVVKTKREKEKQPLTGSVE